jgi:hypothetical protein
VVEPKSTIPGKIMRGRAIRGKKFVPPESDSARNLGQLIVSCHRPHLLGNPYRIGEDGTREEVIARYRGRLEAIMAGKLDILGDNPLKVRAKLESLRREHLRGVELILLCYCWEGEACHVDTLIEWIREGKLEVGHA